MKRESKQPEPRFVQLASADGWLYALDDHGRVWARIAKKDESGDVYVRWTLYREVFVDKTKKPEDQEG